MPQEQCALNKDGTLKDARDIDWYNDVDDEVSLLNTQKVVSNAGNKSKKRKRNYNVFLDLEAGDGSDSDEEDTDIDDNSIGDEDANIPISRLRLTRTMAVVPEEEHYLDYLAKKYTREDKGDRSHYDEHEISYPSVVDKHSIPRGGRKPDDWPLWDVPVNVGSEEEIVHGIFCRADPKHIRSAFASESAPGRIYVEAKTVESVKRFFTIYRDAYINYIIPSPTLSWDTLYRSGKPYLPTPYSWVRLRGKNTSMISRI
ncbi:hypothetical protein BDQ17DRAFT_1368346 [Cyathus striatus]|nr:hypothetical protein BDQ17DRAFT_1368346 [Cyathus striatus]